MNTKKNILNGLIIGFTVSIIIWILDQFLLSGLFNRYELFFYDAKMRKAYRWNLPENGRFKGMDDIIIVDIDARSVSKLGKYYSWPRTYWADLINYLSESGVKAIGIDVIFDPDNRHPVEEKAFLNAIKKAGNVYTGVYISASDQERFLYPMKELPKGFPEKLVLDNPELIKRFPSFDRLEPEFPDLFQACRGVGHVVTLPGVDGVVRSIFPFFGFSGHLFPSFALKIAMDSLGITNFALNANTLICKNDAHEIVRKLDLTDNGKWTVYFNGTFQTFRYISFYDVMYKRIAPEILKNKIVLVGTSLPALYDLRTIPLQEAFPGVEMHANIIYNMLNDIHITNISQLYRFLLLIFMGIFFGLLVTLLRPVKAVIFTVLILVVYMIVSLYLFITHFYVIPDFLIIINLFLILTVSYSYRYFSEEKDKKQIKHIFSHYVSKNVVDVLLDNPKTVKLGGEKKECSVLFSDIESFTTISENLTPEALVNLINEYHTEMTEMVFNNSGFLDKYEGDAIMAVYGAPMPEEKHAYLACKSALEMQKRLKVLQKQWHEQGKPILRCRIGINTGTMIVGNMGSLTRFDYTVMGDEVNLASRLEGANKAYGSQIMIGENTYFAAKDFIIARKLDLLRVKGKNKPVPVYELLALQEENNSELQKKVDYFENGFKAYLNKEWHKAIQSFSALLKIDPNDKPAKVFIKRCENFIQTPPDNSWDGVFTMTTK